MSGDAASPGRVLWLTKGLGLGGTEQLVRLCAPRFDRDRFALEVAYVLPHKDALVPALRAAGVPVHCLAGGATGWAAALGRLLRTRRFDLVHTHSPVPAAVARRTAPRGTRLLHTEHNVWDRYRRPTRIVNAATLHRNERVFAVSAAVAGSVRPWRGRVLPPVEVLHHGIDETRVRHGRHARDAARRRLGLDADELVIGTVGNLTPKKDQATLLRAFAALLDGGTRARLVVVGDGPLRVELEALAATLGITDRVWLTGRRDDVPDVLPGLDAFVLTSVHEGLPIALLEAMASGVPAVVTPVGGTREMLVDGHDGIFVPCGEPAVLARALARLLADPAERRRIGRAAATAAGRFSVDRTVARMEDVYSGLLALRSPVAAP